MGLIREDVSHFFFHPPPAFLLLHGQAYQFASAAGGRRRRCDEVANIWEVPDDRHSWLQQHLPVLSSKQPVALTAHPSRA